MCWWMDLPPLHTPEAGHHAAYVAGGNRNDSAWSERIRHLFDVQIWPLEVFNGVPKTDHIRRYVMSVIEVIAGQCRNADRFGRVPDSVVRNVDADDVLEVLTSDIKKEAVSTSNLK